MRTCSKTDVTAVRAVQCSANAQFGLEPTNRIQRAASKRSAHSLYWIQGSNSINIISCVVLSSLPLHACNPCGLMGPITVWFAHCSTTALASLLHRTLYIECWRINDPRWQLIKLTEYSDLKVVITIELSELLPVTSLIQYKEWAECLLAAPCSSDSLCCS